jgi:hypothetical protein
MRFIMVQIWKSHQFRLIIDFVDGNEDFHLSYSWKANCIYDTMPKHGIYLAKFLKIRLNFDKLKHLG